jgi:hypothetical protein
MMVCLFLMQSCSLLNNDCSDPEPLARGLEDWIPYENQDELYFESSTGKDTLLINSFGRGWYDSPNKCTPPAERIAATLTSTNSFSDSLMFHGSGSYITFLVMWAKDKIHVQYNVRENTFTGSPLSSSLCHDFVVLEGKRFDDAIVSKCDVCLISEIVLARGLGVVAYTVNGVRWTRVN